MRGETRAQLLQSQIKMTDGNSDLAQITFLYETFLIHVALYYCAMKCWAKFEEDLKISVANHHFYLTL